VQPDIPGAWALKDKGRAGVGGVEQALERAQRLERRREDRGRRRASAVALQGAYYSIAGGTSCALVPLQLVMSGNEPCRYVTLSRRGSAMPL
jgi:hypothetical protein